MSLFITFEGTEGCGKTTQIKRLADHLRASGYPVLATREPGGCPIADRIRSVLLDPDTAGLTPISELMLYTAARAQHLHDVIRPAIAQGTVVLCDRFSDATRAYQGAGRQLPSATVQNLIQLATQGLEPDLTLLFDLPVEIGLQRSLRRLSDSHAPAEDRFEREELAFHQRIQQGYHQLAAEAPGRIKLLDASGSVEQVEQRVRRSVLQALER